MHTISEQFKKRDAIYGITKARVAKGTHDAAGNRLNKKAITPNDQKNA